MSAILPTSTPASLGTSASEVQSRCRAENQIRCQSLFGVELLLHNPASRVVRTHSSGVFPLSVNRSVNFQTTYTGAHSRSRRPIRPTPENAQPRRTCTTMPSSAAAQSHGATTTPNGVASSDNAETDNRDQEQLSQWRDDQIERQIEKHSVAPAPRLLEQ